MRGKPLLAFCSLLVAFGLFTGAGLVQAQTPQPTKDSIAISFGEGVESCLASLVWTDGMQTSTAVKSSINGVPRDVLTLTDIVSTTPQSGLVATFTVKPGDVVTAQLMGGEVVLDTKVAVAACQAPTPTPTPIPTATPVSSPTPAPTSVVPAPGRLTVRKQTTNLSSALFSFSTSITLARTFGVASQGSNFIDLPSGDYFLTENRTVGWHVKDIRCRSDLGLSDFDFSSVTFEDNFGDFVSLSNSFGIGRDVLSQRVGFHLDPGEHIVCWFLNEPDVAPTPVPTVTPMPTATPAPTATPQPTAVPQLGFDQLFSTCPSGVVVIKGASCSTPVPVQPAPIVQPVAQTAPATTAPVIRPPSTGDAGLKRTPAMEHVDMFDIVVCDERGNCEVICFDTWGWDFDCCG